MCFLREELGTKKATLLGGFSLVFSDAYSLVAGACNQCSLRLVSGFVERIAA